jgi:type IV pilus assembly protein PilN
MRLNINLASQPYEDARLFWMRWGTGLSAAVIITMVLLAMTISGWFVARRDHADIAELKAEIAKRDQTRQQAEDFLNRPENRSTRDQSQFINELIERKAFSWTRVLEDLEKVMPTRVHLVAISPELDQDNELTLKLAVAGDSHDRALELARRMEDSRRFSKTFIASEAFRQETVGGGPSSSPDTFQFGIEAIYIPETVPMPSAKAETASPKAETTKPQTKTSSLKSDASNKTEAPNKTSEVSKKTVISNRTAH